MKKVIYVTGCLGFIGYHIAHACLEQGWYVRGVDKITYAANYNFLSNLKEYSNFVFDHKDINDIDMLYDCDYIINCAAETHVDNSIAASDLFLRSNINGVHHLLNLIKSKSSKKMPILLHFSTDEVYGDINEGFHTENDLLKPSNPYSATKAAADMLITAWARTYNIPYVIVRPTNNYGIGQYVEKLIPLTIKYLHLEKPVPLHNSGNPKRTWLHVNDTADAIITIIKSGVVNETYNISGNYEITNYEVVDKIVKIMNLPNITYHYVDLSYTRPGQDVRYAICDQKLKKLGWQPKVNFNQALEDIVNYYRTCFVW